MHPLIAHLEANHCFGVCCESNTKLRQTLNARYEHKFKGPRSASETIGHKLHCQERNNLDNYLRPLNDRSGIKEVAVEVGVLRQLGVCPVVTTLKECIIAH